MANQSTVCCIGCSICLLLVALILVLVSIGTVEPIEYGIAYNAITKKVDTDAVYPGGWYFIGPTTSFITYPSTYINLDFTHYPGAQAQPLTVKDKGGQDIVLSMSIQYKLQEENIGKLYSEYQKTYETNYINFIDSVVRKEVGKFNSTAFWTDRQASGNILRAAIDERLSQTYANCNNL